jgi:hypothetical protein
MRLATGACLSAALALELLVAPHSALAQGLKVPRVRDTNVGYIDPAIPGNVLRVRYDSVYDNLRPTLGEMFWPPGPPNGPGPPIPERRVNYQDLAAYVEALVSESTSVFANIPVRFLDPDLNANTAGLGVTDFGFRRSLIACDGLSATFQLRTYVPSGDYRRGLGNSLVGLEPALLVYLPLGDQWGIEGEVRDWIPIGGTDFAGNTLRYGVGLWFDALCTEELRVTPIAEFVGWSLLDGRVSVHQPGGPPLVENAAGDTIVNAKLGVRVKLGERLDLYTGYGRPVTGDFWYQHVYRLELRLFY